MQAKRAANGQSRIMFIKSQSCSVRRELGRVAKSQDPLARYLFHSMSRRTSTLDRQSVKPSDTAYQLVWLLSFLSSCLLVWIGWNGIRMGMDRWSNDTNQSWQPRNRGREARIMGGNMPPPTHLIDDGGGSEWSSGHVGWKSQ